MFRGNYGLFVFAKGCLENGFKVYRRLFQGAGSAAFTRGPGLGGAQLDACVNILRLNGKGLDVIENREPVIATIQRLFRALDQF